MRHRRFDPRSTAAIYENPANGWREGVPRLAWLWMLLFGVFYMMVRSLWRPLAICMGILVFITILFAPLLVLAVPIIWGVSAIQAHDMLRAHYMRQGWVELDPYDKKGTTF